MKILRHGEQAYGFICKQCGCVWRVGESETENGYMDCPDCGNRTSGKVMYPKDIFAPKSIADQEMIKTIEKNDTK